MVNKITQTEGQKEKNMKKRVPRSGHRSGQLIFNKSTKIIQWRQESLFLVTGAGTPGYLEAK